MTASGKAIQKLIPARRSAGKIRNIGSEGRKNHSTLCESCAMRSLSPVSFQRQRNASNEIRGSDSINPPTPGERRAISEAVAMMRPQITAFTSNIRNYPFEPMGRAAGGGRLPGQRQTSICVAMQPLIHIDLKPRG
jgi:hypothetical protein